MSEEVDILIKKLAKEADSRQRQTLLTGKLAGKSGKEFDRLTKQIKTAAAEYTKANKEDKEAIKNLKKVNKELKDTEKSFDKFDGELRKASQALKPFKDSMMTMGDASGEGTKKLSNMFDMFSQFGATGGLISGVARSFDYMIETFTSLSQVGAQFGNDMLGMQRAANEARLPLGEFSALIQDNAPALASLFNSTQEGARQMIGFTKGVRDAASDEGLYGLGITVEDLNEYMGTYLQTQRFRGRAAAVSQQVVIDQTIKYTKELDLLAKLTGTSRKALDDQVKAQQADAVWQRAKAGMTADQITQADALIASLDNVDPALADQAKSIMATGIGFGDLGNTLMGMNPQLVETLRNFKGLTNSGKTATDIMGMLGESGRNFNDTFQDAAVLKFAGGAVGDVGNAMQKLSTITVKDIEDQRKQQTEMKKANEVLKPFRKGMKDLNAAFGELKVEFFSHIVPAITGFTKFITGPFKDTLLGFADFMQDNPKTTAALIVGGLGATILFDMAKQITIVATGVRLGMVGKGMGGASGIGKVAKVVGKAGVVGAGVGGAAIAGQYAAGADTHLKKGAGILGAAASGAMAGAMFGPLGAAAGGLLGGIYGAFKAYNKNAEKAVSSYDEGTIGSGSLFQDFGKGTPAMLHGMEAVVTKDQMDGLLAGAVKASGQSAEDTGGGGGGGNDAVSNGNDAISKAMATLNQTNSQMLEKLNMLVAIESATERNTKLTNRVIAGGGGDLVGG